MAEKGYRKVKTDERGVEYYEDEHFIWKLEGSVRFEKTLSPKTGVLLKLVKTK